MKKNCGYTCIFVEEPPDLFKCGVCGLVLRDPQITECCRKNACRPCIDKAANNDEPCPISACKSAQVRGFGDRTLKYEILERRVYCYSKANGCHWADKLEKLDKHMEECPFVEVKCQHLCGADIQRQNIEAHEAVCQQFLLACHLCGSTYQRQHHSHHLKVCPFTTVKCPFNIVGCTSEVLNKDLQKHFNEALSSHYSLVTSQSQDVQAQVKETELILLEQKEKISTRNTEVEAINREVIVAQEKIIKLQSALEKTELEFQELKRKFVDSDKVKIQNQLDERDATFKALKKDTDNLTVESKVRCYGPALPRPHPTDIVSRPLDCLPTTEEYTPRVTFSIANFHIERKNDALLCLPPFFSHRGGYKLCLLVCCNGYGQARNRSLTIHVRVLRGAYDSYLQWPLNCRIMIKLRNGGNTPLCHTKHIEVKSQPRVVDDACVLNFSSCDVIPLKVLRQWIDDVGCLCIDIPDVLKLS